VLSWEGLFVVTLTDVSTTWKEVIIISDLWYDSWVQIIYKVYYIVSKLCLVPYAHDCEQQQQQSEKNVAQVFRIRSSGLAVERVYRRSQLRLPTSGTHMLSIAWKILYARTNAASFSFRYWNVSCRLSTYVISSTYYMYVSQWAFLLFNLLTAIPSHCIVIILNNSFLAIFIFL